MTSKQNFKDNYFIIQMVLMIYWYYKTHFVDIKFFIIGFSDQNEILFLELDKGKKKLKIIYIINKVNK